MNGAVASTSTTSITIDASDNNKFAVNGAVVVNSETGEVMRASADTTGTTLTVVRNIGGTTHQIADIIRVMLIRRKSTTSAIVKILSVASAMAYDIAALDSTS